MNYAAEERSRQNVNKSHGRFQPRPDLADGGGGTGLHHLLLHPILLPSGHQVNYRLRVWKGNQKVDIQT